ncbi:MAG: ABC transporter substrate-binding protein [Phycisphaerae bacterium]|nr:ABC transporter substrate-binding protein [Phycisphaerae bacterium]
MAPNAAEILWELGAASQLVGVSEFTVYPPALAELPRVGGVRDANLEQILVLEPDLVILRGRQEKLEELCRARGIRIYHDPTETLPDLYRAIEDLGRLCDRNDAANQLAQRLRDDLTAIRRRVADRPKVPVLLTIRSPDRLADVTTAARGSYLHEVIELAGGRNVFGELDIAYPQVTVEEIVARAPAVIIEAVPGADSTVTNGMAAQWQSLSTIPAVRTGRIHVLTEDYVLIPSPRVVQLAERVAELLHPEVGRE